MKYALIWTLFFPGYPPASYVNSYHTDLDDCLTSQGWVNQLFDGDAGKIAKAPRIQTSCRPLPKEWYEDAIKQARQK